MKHNKIIEVTMCLDGEFPTILRIPYGFSIESGYVGAEDALALAFYALKRELPVENRATTADPGGLY